MNIVAQRVSATDVDGRLRAQVKDVDLADAIELDRQAQRHAAGSDGFRAVAPPVMNFGAGRRR